jgi:hypothetical protein
VVMLTGQFDSYLLGCHASFRCGRAFYR